MQALFLIFSFILGVIVGSFLNVVILRFNSGKQITGRSACASCGNTLSWWELIPIFSFFYLRGRCQRCGSNISFQYPLVELGTGILFFLSSIFVLTRGIISEDLVGEIALIYIIMSTLMAITVYDMRHKIIPDAFVLAFIILSLIFLLQKEGTPTSIELIAGPLLGLPFALLWLVSGGKWMGLGDSKLAVGIGIFLGLSGGIFAILIAFWAGALVGLALIFLRVIGSHNLFAGLPRFTIKSEIPFGPFLIFGTLITFFLGLDMTLLGIPLL